MRAGFEFFNAVYTHHGFIKAMQVEGDYDYAGIFKVHQVKLWQQRDTTEYCIEGGSPQLERYNQGYLNGHVHHLLEQIGKLKEFAASNVRYAEKRGKRGMQMECFKTYCILRDTQEYILARWC